MLVEVKNRKLHRFRSTARHRWSFFFFEIGEVVSNIRAYVRQDKWERAMDKFVMTSAEDWQQDKNTTGCISVPLVSAIKVSKIIESSVSYAHTKQ